MGKVLKLREVGDEALSKIAEEVNILDINNEILDIIEDMKETLNFGGGFGIAAPQIGVSKRIVILQVDKKQCKYKDCEDFPTTVMINPTWRNLSDEKYTEYEGCLSVPIIRRKS